MHLLLKGGDRCRDVVCEVAVVGSKCLYCCLYGSVCLPKLLYALLKKFAFFFINFFGIHAVSQTPGSDGLLLELCLFLPENLEVEPRFVVFLDP